MINSLLSSGNYVIVDKIKKRIITIESVLSKMAFGYNPACGEIVINFKTLEKALAEKRFRLKYVGN